MRDRGQRKINTSDKQRKGFIILNELSFSFSQGWWLVSNGQKEYFTTTYVENNGENYSSAENVNPFFKFKSPADTQPIRAAWAPRAFCKHFIKIAETNTVLTVTVFDFTSEVTRNWSCDKRGEVMRATVTSHPCWAWQTPTVKQEPQNWPVTRLVLVYHGLWWESDCHGERLGTRLNLQSTRFSVELHCLDATWQ